MSFINASLAGFLGLAAIPIIIYLINRQRYRRRKWAAMEFLLRAMRKNQRRLRLENLLLLLIRTLAIVLLVLAFMRPILETEALPVIGTQARAEIVIIDRSYSMAVREGGRTVLAEAVSRAKQRVKALEKGDRLGVFLAGGFPRVMFQEPQVVTDGSLPRHLALLDGVELVYEPLQLATTLQRVAQWLESAPEGGAWQIHFYTDLQERDWLTEEGASDGAVSEAIRRIEDLGSLIELHPLGPVKPRNATVAALTCDDSLLCRDLPTSFNVRVENNSRDALAGLEVELWIDEALQGSRKISLDPGEVRGVSFPHVFREVGLARVRAVVKSDDLVEDNSYFAVFRVRDSVDILVVDGGRAGETSEETAWLVPAIGADLTNVTEAERLTPFRCDLITPSNLVSTELDEYEVVVLADVGTFEGSDSDVLEAFVQQGGGVLVFLGDRADVRSYGERAYRGGDGWFPFKVGAPIVVNPTEVNYEWEVVQQDHPATAYLSREEGAGLGLVRVHGYRAVESPVSETQVLFRYDDYSGTPAVVEKLLGDGVTIVVNTGPDRQWSNLPITPAFVCLVQESLPYLAARSDVSRNLGILEPYERIVASDEYAYPVYLFMPDGKSARMELPDRPDQKGWDLRVAPQAVPGLFEIRFGRQDEDEEGGAGEGSAVRRDYFAVNVNPLEGRLARREPEELIEIYGNPALVFRGLDREAPESGEAFDSRGEIWRSVLWVVLALLILESGLARWFGRVRA